MSDSPPPLRSCLGCGINSCGLFLAPFLVFFCGMLIFSDKQFASTAGIFSTIFLLMLVPTFGMLLIATIAKVRKDRAARPGWSWPELFVSIIKHAGIPRRAAGVLWAGVFYHGCHVCQVGFGNHLRLRFCCSIPSLGSQPHSDLRVNAFHAFKA